MNLNIGPFEKATPVVRMSERNLKAPPPPTAAGDEAAGEGHVVRLDWRTDAEESLSDWKIEIKVDGKIRGTYSVHRCILSVGSKYFARLFANKRLKEHETQSSYIEMEELAAQAFPVMLDYLYNLWDSDGLPISTENAVPLNFFGRYFEISGLRREACVFWNKAMTIDQAVTYLEHATIFLDDYVYHKVVENCVSLIHSIKVDSPLIEVSDTKFWLSVLREKKDEPNPDLSTLVSCFCSQNREALDTETFLKLTDQSTLPMLSGAAAIELLQLEKHFLPTPASAGALSSIQERSLEALISCGEEDQHVLVKFQQHCKDLPPLVVSLMLQRSISKVWDCNKKQKVRGVSKEIVVSGAGIGAVNGTYYLINKLREGAPSFVMDGTWEGSPAKFELYLYRHRRQGDPKYTWFISILQGSEPGLHDTDFYDSPTHLKENLWQPPKTGWFGARDSVLEPTLTLSFRFAEHSVDAS